MMTRREAARLLGMAVGSACLPRIAFATSDSTPALLPGSPNSPERRSTIEAFVKQSEGLQNKFEARTHKSDWMMPYRLFRPQAHGKLPLIMYLHGSGGLGNDNEKQLALGNIFGTRVWLLPENQKKFPCYVLAPQTDRGWVHYEFSEKEDVPPKIIPGLGDGNRLALEIIESLRKEFSIDERRMYVMGQSMGGSGVWNLLKDRPNYFAAAVPLCGAEADDDGTGSIDTPVWNFHGDSDQSVPVTLSRERITARRKAGGHPLYTEYAGVDHNVWRWAFTEPALVTWLFEQKRPR